MKSAIGHKQIKILWTFKKKFNNIVFSFSLCLLICVVCSRISGKLPLISQGSSELTLTLGSFLWYSHRNLGKKKYLIIFRYHGWLLPSLEVPANGLSLVHCTSLVNMYWMSAALIFNALINSHNSLDPAIQSRFTLLAPSDLLDSNLLKD